MELLYIWIKEYANIENQGFNFNPNFYFDVEEIQGKYRVNNNKKSDTEYNQEGFFGKNISNITGIIGKNGSGKSNLLWFIFRKILSTKERQGYAKSINNDFILVLKKSCDNQEKILVYSTEEIDLIEDNLSYQYSKYNEKSQESFQHILTNEINKFINFNTLFFTPIFKTQYEWKDNSNNLSLYKAYEENRTQAEINVNNIKFIGYYLKKKFNFKEINIPKNLRIIPRQDSNADDFSMNPGETEIERRVLESLQRILKYYYGHTKYMEINGRNSLNFNNIKECIDITQEIENFYDKEQNNPRYKYIYNIKNIYLEKSTHNQITDEEKNEKLYNYAKNMNIILTKHWDKIGGEFSLEDEDIINFIELYNYTVLSTFDNKQNRLVSNDWLEFQYSPELSSGEEHMISIYGVLYNYFKDAVKGDYVILLDEPDIFMHPEWQRKMINSLCIFFNEVLKLDKETKIHLVISSHSPFIASDLPKENIIMLDKTEDGKCVLKDNKIETFGANIFNLYKEAFFVESSFGEFAKEKIQGIVSLYENNRDKDGNITYPKEKEIEDRKDETKCIISSIGEHLIKRKLHDIYDEYETNKLNNRENKKLLEEFDKLSIEEKLQLMKLKKENSGGVK